MFILFIVLSYLAGSIPFGYIFAKFKNVDIKKVGSGNIGATNISREVGIKYAILVGLLDIAKGAIPVFIASILFPNDILISLIALATIIGNIFPLFLHFKGGKGVSTYGGTLLIILGWKLFIVLLLIWLAYLYISKVMSLVNLTISLILPAVFLFGFGSGAYFIYSLVAASLIWQSHRENIKRLTSGTEKKISFHK